MKLRGSRFVQFARFAGAAIAIFGASTATDAARAQDASPIEVRKVTGTVTEVAEDWVLVHADDGEYRFEATQVTPVGRPPLVPGDTVTVWYSLDAKAVKVHSQRRVHEKQLPGQAAPGTPRRKRLRKYIDDRAFYPAKVEETIKDVSSS